MSPFTFPHQATRIASFLLAVSLLLAPAHSHAQAPSFVRGADVSWCTEMESDGYVFYDSEGNETDLFALMKSIGMNTIRLRVWVDPQNAYGPWCDKADVVNKAVRAAEQGLSVMIDFHYSDFFADPSRQNKPAAWSGYSISQLAQAIEDHTVDVLQTLDSAGVTPAWVQVGNETTNAMLWDSTSDETYLWYTSAGTWDTYATLSNAGYDAVKSVFPDAYVIVHIDKASTQRTWWWSAFTAAGGKFDMIGLSHYPSTSYATENTNAAKYAQALADTYDVPVMIVEVGYSSDDEDVADAVISDVFSKVRAQEDIVGIIYWEPEVYNWWKPAYYYTLGWNAYSLGAFTSAGSPSAALNAFYEDALADGITRVSTDTPSEQACYNLQGQRVPDTTPGLLIQTGPDGTRKVLRR